MAGLCSFDASILSCSSIQLQYYGDFVDGIFFIGQSLVNVSDTI